MRAALLEAERPADILEVADRLGAIRVELTSIVCPSADHIGWSRLGSTFRPSELDHALATGVLFERAWFLRPMADLPLFLAGMKDYPYRAGGGNWLEANADFADGILERIADVGPLTSRDIPDESVVPWMSTGWNANRNVTQMLELLHMTGRLAVVGRAGRLRVWDLAEHVFPAVEEVPREEATLRRSERLLGALGIARESRALVPTELHTNTVIGEPVTVEDVPGRWRVDPRLLDDDVDGSFEGRTTILSPFDRLFSDQPRIQRLFGFDYTLEVYKPATTRKWGAFALPILQGDRLIGKLDARADRDAGALVVHRIHEDEPFDAATRAAVDEQVEDFAGWLRLRVVRD